MATYFVVDENGNKVRELTSFPVKIENGLRLSIRDIVYVNTRSSPDNEYCLSDYHGFEDSDATAITDSNYIGSNRYQVIINVLGSDPRDVAKLHKIVREEVRSLPKPSWFQAMFPHS